MPVVADLAIRRPKLRPRIHEHEPAEALALLAADDVDLALTYDYNLAPATVDRTFEARWLWSAARSLAVPHTMTTGGGGDAAVVFGQFRDVSWIVNSRGSADERVVRTIASMAGFEPHIGHRADSLDLVAGPMLTESPSISAAAWFLGTFDPVRRDEGAGSIQLRTYGS